MEKGVISENVPEELEKRDEKNKKNNIPKWIIKPIIIVVVVLLFVLGIKYSYNLVTQTKTTKLGFEDVGELVTQTAHLTIVKDLKDDRDLFNIKIPFTESRQIYSYDVEVDASVDFSQITYDVMEEKEEIIIRLPHAQIYKPTIDPNSFVCYLDTESLFSRLDLKEENTALQEIEEEAKINAQENGILERADENAKRLIESFIKSNEAYKEYNIIYDYLGE